MPPLPHRMPTLGTALVLFALLVVSALWTADLAAAQVPVVPSAEPSASPTASSRFSAPPVSSPSPAPSTSPVEVRLSPSTQRSPSPSTQRSPSPSPPSALSSPAAPASSPEPSRTPSPRVSPSPTELSSPFDPAALLTTSPSPSGSPSPAPLASAAAGGTARGAERLLLAGLAVAALLGLTGMAGLYLTRESR